MLLMESYLEHLLSVSTQWELLLPCAGLFWIKLQEVLSKIKYCSVSTLFFIKEKKKKKVRVLPLGMGKDRLFLKMGLSYNTF